MTKHHLKKWGGKFVLSVMLSCCVAGAAASPVYAASLPDDENGIDIQAEQTEWRYRIYNQRMQRRLWSYTQEKWLTDWEYC